MSPSLLSGGPRKEVVMNIDPTNQGSIPNDPGGWSGYAAIRVGDDKLVLGWPGIPDSWCWPNQNKTKEVLASATECPRGEGGVSLDLLSVVTNAESVAHLAKPLPWSLGNNDEEDADNSTCGAPPGGTPACCLRGKENPDLRSFMAEAANDCCAPCLEDPKCMGFVSARHPLSALGRLIPICSPSLSSSLPPFCKWCQLLRAVDQLTSLLYKITCDRSSTS